MILLRDHGSRLRQKLAAHRCKEVCQRGVQVGRQSQQLSDAPLARQLRQRMGGKGGALGKEVVEARLRRHLCWLQRWALWLDLHASICRHDSPCMNVS